MAVVAPVTAVLAAMIPVGVGFVTEGLPNQVVIGGIALAIIAVVLVSRVEDESDGRSAGLGLAVVAGVGFGLFGACIGQLSDGHVFGPLTVVRATEAVMLIGVIVVTRSGWRPPRDLVLAICAVGVLDMAGNGAYILSAQAGLAGGRVGPLVDVPGDDRHPRDDRAARADHAHPRRWASRSPPRPSP